MKMIIGMGFFGFCASLAMAADPVWLDSAKKSQLEKIGISVTGDEIKRGNYYVRFVAKKDLTVDLFKCPQGSTVDVSRTVILVLPPKTTLCTDGVKTAKSLKLKPDGTTQAL